MIAECESILILNANEPCAKGMFQYVHQSKSWNYTSTRAYTAVAKKCEAKNVQIGSIKTMKFPKSDTK
jgi:hypothetical protein